MSGKFKLQELEKCSAVLHRDWKLQGALMGRSARFLLFGRLLFISGDLQCHAELSRGQRARLQPRTDSLEHSVQNEHQWIEQLDRVFQFNGFFKLCCWLNRDKRALRASASKFL